MVFCYSDIFPGNFILDLDQRRVAVIDFSVTSILPSSFAMYALQHAADFHGLDCTDLVKVPGINGVENSSAVESAYGPIVQGSGSFAKIGRRVIAQLRREEEERRKEECKHDDVQGVLFMANTTEHATFSGDDRFDEAP